jgi:glycosyltransferase involved in cell wall biosynthesis
MIKPKVMLIGGPDVDARIDLMHQLKSNFEISAIGSNPSLHAKFKSEGFTYEYYYLAREINPFSDVFSLVRLIMILRRLRPQIVHAFDTKPGVWGCIAAHLSGVPLIICTSTGLGSLYKNDSLLSKMAWFVYKKLQTIASHLSDATVFQNHDDAEYFITHRMVKKEKVEIILGSGVRTDIFDPAQVSAGDINQLKNEFDIKNGEIVVTMISRIIRSKGVMQFLEAAEAIMIRNSNTRFILVGPDDRESLDRLSDEELDKVKSTLTCPGAREDIKSILAVSDIFVLPSAYREGLPRVLLEASSMALPLITTNSPGCNETIEEGKNGILIATDDTAALTDAILKLTEDPDLRLKFGNASRQRAIRNFDLNVVANLTGSLYQKLLSHNGLSPQVSVLEIGSNQS